MLKSLYLIKKTLSRADLFGQPIMLNFRSKDNYQTVFGGVTSIVFIVLFSMLFFSQAMSLFDRDQYTILQELKLNFDPPAIKINQDNFIFALNIVDSEINGNRIFFDFQLVYKLNIKDPETNKINQTVEQITLVNCTKAHFPNFGEQQISIYFVNYNLQNYKCPPLGFEYDLQGIYNKDVFKYLKIQIVPCNNSDPTKQCETQENLQAYLAKNKYFKFQFIPSKYQIHPEQKVQYEKIMFDDIYFTFTPEKIYTIADIYIKEYVLQEDSSILPFTQSVSNTKLFQAIQQDIKSFQVVTDNKKVFGEFYLRLSTESINITKSYQKIDRYLAYVGGILKIVLSILGFLIIEYNNFDLHVTMANRLFNFDGQNEFGQGKYDAVKGKINDMIHMIKVRVKRKSLGTKPDANLYMDIHNKMNIGQDSNTNNKQHHSEIYSIKAKNLDPKLHFQENFFNQCVNEIISCKRVVVLRFKYIVSLWTNRIFFYDTDSEVQQIDAAIKMIKKQFNVNRLLDRLQTVDRFKELFFNKNQVCFLNHLQQPIIKARNIKVEKAIKFAKQHDLNNQASYRQMIRYEKLFKSYEHIIKSPDNLPTYEKVLNQRLLSMLDDDLKKLFDFCLILPQFPKIQTKDENQEADREYPTHFRGNTMKNLQRSMMEMDEESEPPPQQIYQTKALPVNREFQKVRLSC